jgi:hypothetical protein
MEYQLGKIYQKTSTISVDIATPYEQTGKEAPYCPMPILIFRKYITRQVDIALHHLICFAQPNHSYYKQALKNKNAIICSSVL